MLLILDKTQKEAEGLAAAFSYMGILAFCASEQGFEKELSPLFTTLLVNSAKDEAHAEYILEKVAKYKLNVPVFFISDKTLSKSENAHFIPRLATLSEVLGSIIRVQKSLDMPLLGEYKLGGFDLSSAKGGAEFFFTEIPFTAKERTILRLLIKAYPSKLTAEEILKYAFLPSARPDVSCVRTHISLINKTAINRIGIKIIDSQAQSGYALNLPLKDALGPKIS